MPPGHDFLHNLALVLCIAAITTVVFQRLHQPVVLGYLLAGMIVGPHVPIPLVADKHVVETLAELGVILLMFSLGLEFSFARLLQAGPVAGLVGLVEMSVTFWAGYILARFMDWPVPASIFLGAIVSISSTTIVAKAFHETRVEPRLKDLVFGILVIEDLVAVLLMAVLTSVAAGHELEADALLVTVGRLVAFLAGMVSLGLLVVPRTMRLILRLNRPETTLVASVGICFALSLLAKSFGYSNALGAFLAGVLIAESGHPKPVEHLVQPLKDLFTAVYFVSVGMIIDPRSVGRHAEMVGLAAVVVVVGKALGVGLGVVLAGRGLPLAVQSGLCLGQIGEFSFILAAMGRKLGTEGRSLYPIAVAVAVVTTLITPWMIALSGRAATAIDRVLPHRLQVLISLYSAWVERLATTSRGSGLGTKLRRLAGFLLLDVSAVVVVVIGSSVSLKRTSSWIGAWLELTPELARISMIFLTAAVCLPFGLGIFALVGRIATLLAEALMPPREGGEDGNERLRQALRMVFLMALLVVVLVPMGALLQPFLSRYYTLAAVFMSVMVLMVVGWNSATNLQGEVRAGAEVLIGVLAKEAQGDQAPREELGDQLREALPGAGAIASVELEAGSPAVGRTLAALNLRGLTGATVLAISRGDSGVVVPTGHEELRSGDVLALAGASPAIQAARELLMPKARGPKSSPRTIGG